MINLCPCDGEIYLFKAFYGAADADRLFDELYRSLAWREESIRVFGRVCQAPRLLCWYGDPGAVYTYSGVLHEPLPWHPELLAIKSRIEAHCSAAFNSVLGNLYRNGQDSMGYHADNEPELGKNPPIASLSLGATRLFKLRHNKCPERLDILLANGDLLLMAGALQHHWRHALPKTRQVAEPRINLTFRRITENQ